MIIVFPCDYHEFSSQVADQAGKGSLQGTDKAFTLLSMSDPVHQVSEQQHTAPSGAQVAYILWSLP